MDKSKLKNYLIIALIAVVVLLGIFGGRAVTKYRDEINLLKSNNNALKTENVKIEGEKAILNDSITVMSKEIARLMGIFRIKDREITVLTTDLNSALAFLNFMTGDSSYQFLQDAYNYPGVLKYLFNEPQVKHLHEDYLVARNSEKIIPVLTGQINNCKEQFSVRDSMVNALRQLSNLQKQQIANCEKMDANNNNVIKDLEKQRNKERRRKNFWRATSAVATGVCIVISVFGL